MFKNPIKKYQSGGPVTQEQAEDQIVSVIALQLSGGDQQKAKSLLGPVKQRLQEIKSNEQESQILKAGLQKLQNNDESGMQDILSLFANAPQKAKLGAKIRDFICKHANGKKIPDCGCNEDGGKVEMHQQKNGGRGKVAYPRQTSAGKENGYSIANRTWENNIDGSTSSVEIAVGPDGKAVLQRITDRSNMPDRGMLAVRDTVNHIGIVNPLTGIFEEDYDNPGFSTGAHPYFQEIPWNQVKYWSPDYKNGGKTPNWINKKKNK